MKAKSGLTIYQELKAILYRIDYAKYKGRFMTIVVIEEPYQQKIIQLLRNKNFLLLAEKNRNINFWVIWAGSKEFYHYITGNNVYEIDDYERYLLLLSYIDQEIDTYRNHNRFYESFHNNFQRGFDKTYTLSKELLEHKKYNWINPDVSNIASNASQIVGHEIRKIINSY